MIATMNNEPAEPAREPDEPRDTDGAPLRTESDATGDGPDAGNDLGARPDAPPHVTPLDSTSDEPQDGPPPTAAETATGATADTAAETAQIPATPAPDQAAGPTDVPPPGSAVPPPGGGAMPESGGAAPETGGAAPGAGAPTEAGPPLAPTGGYAAQHGLVRPRNGRYIAGVCGALARATNTDPVLWRVLLPVLMVVGLLGGLIYLLGWLLIPSEGDSASPFEALIGRGQSSMSQGWAIFLAIFTAIIAFSGFAFGRGGRFLLFAAIVGGAILLISSRNRSVGWPGNAGSAGPWAAPPPGAPAPGAPQAAPAAGTLPGAPAAGPIGVPMGVPAGATAGWAPSTGGDTTPAPAWSAQPVTVEPPPGRQPTPTSTFELPSTYQPPFAPHGPYAPTDPYTQGASGMPPQPPAALAPRPPKPTGSRRAILSSVVLAVGLLGILDLSNVVNVPVAGYFAVALAVIGLGMIVASFFGRVRGPITLGILLVVGLSVTSAVNAFHGDYNNRYTFKPATVAELQPSYSEDTGRMRLDLSDLRLPGNHEVDIHLNAGLVQVIVPPNTDVTVMSHVNLGATDAFGHQRGGVGNGPFQVTDDGPDGPGGGLLLINADVNIGKVEVSR
jgi:phage shock protein PspC (stress-responsive transcriptional regulator)